MFLFVLLYSSLKISNTEIEKAISSETKLKGYIYIFPVFSHKMFDEIKGEKCILLQMLLFQIRY